MMRNPIFRAFPMLLLALLFLVSNVVFNTSNEALRIVVASPGDRDLLPQDALRRQADMQQLGGLSPDPAFSLSLPVSNTPGSMTSIGDTNGDGLTDYLVNLRAQDGNVGRVYFYSGVRMGAGASPTTIIGGQPSTPARFGNSIAGIGDINGDGLADFAIGQPSYSYLQNTQNGSVNIYLGRTDDAYSTLTGVSVIEPVQGQSGGYYGYGGSIDGAGDVNNDGYADLIVGAPGHFATAGAAYIYFGGPEGLPSQPSQILRAPNMNGEFFGDIVRGIGDINGDGIDDVAVTRGNRIYIFLGHSSGTLTPLAAITLPSNPAITNPDGVLELTGVGDVNGDGYNDLLAGTGDGGGTPNGSFLGLGAAYLYLGGPGGPSDTPTLRIGALIEPNSELGCCFGAELAGAADLNADGYADVVIGGGTFRTFIFFRRGNSHVLGWRASQRASRSAR